METPLRVLLIEDSESDAELIIRQLKKAGYAVTSERIETAAQMSAALEEQVWDCVIADYKLPQFDAPAALAVLQATGLDLPFVVVSGTIGEETAVALMKAGAHDYVMKDNLVRLAPAVKRELTEAQIRRERQQAEAALRESEARLRQVTSSVREALWLRDARTLEVLYVNPAYEELWGRTCESLYQDPRSFLEAVLPEDKDQVMQAIQKQYQGVFFNQEYRIIRPDGSVRWIWGRTFPIRDEAGQLVRVTAIAEDITERKQMEDALRDLNATLEQRVADRTRRLYEANAHLSELDQLKDQFISRISHELRTPLTNIISYHDLLEHGKPEKHAQYLQVLHEQTALLRGLIESLLEVTQKSVNEAGVHMGPTDLNQLVTALLTKIAPRAAQRGLTLGSALTPELLFVLADGRLLAHAMSKLATNALNYTPAGGTIDLATAEVIDAGMTWITFTIRDSGPGIAPDELAYIFDRFYRGRAAADYKTPGVGLGLSISRDILTSMDGRLTVDSQPGEGATFTAWLKPA